MKTNTNRIQKNRSAARTAPQVKTSHKLQPPSVNGSLADAENDHANLPAGGGTFLFFDQIEDETLASVPIRAEQLAGLKRRAANCGCSAGHFVRRGLDRALAELEGKYDVRSKAEKMHAAVTQVNVLMELIANHLNHREHRSGENFSGERADTFNWGLEMLIKNTSGCLEKADKEMTNAAFQKNEVAA